MYRYHPIHLLLLFLFCVVTYPGHVSYCQELDAAGYYKRAAKMAASGDIEQAIGVFKKSVEKNRYYSLAHYGLGKAYLYRGKIENAIDHLEKAAEYDSRFAPAFFYLGLAYLFDKRYNASIDAFSKTLKLDTSINEARYNIGVAYDESGRSIKASVFYERFFYESKKKEMDILF